MNAVSAQRWAQTIGAYQADSVYQTDIRQIVCVSATGTFDILLPNGARFSMVVNQGPIFEGKLENFKVVDTSGSSNSIVLRVLSGARWADNSNQISSTVEVKEIYRGAGAYTPVTVNYTAATMIANYTLGKRGSMVILNSHTETCYLGASTVTSDTGFALPPGYGIEYKLADGNLYGRFTTSAGRIDRWDQHKVA